MKVKLNDGRCAMIDRADYRAIKSAKWYSVVSASGTTYASRRAIVCGKQTTIYMHRQIMGFPDGYVDHANGNGLDNRRKNLRIATQAQNNANFQKRRVPASGYHGVWRNRKMYISCIIMGGVRTYLGSYADPKDASDAYQNAHRNYYGEFSVYRDGRL